MTARTVLRRGWTTGSCATAAAKAAWLLLTKGECPNPVQITLPGGTIVAFSINSSGREETHAWASVIKDAGDDPDVTHGALIRVDVAFAQKGEGIRFRAGEGVGTITRPGLPLPPGEPAINPVPRAMITAALGEEFHTTIDATVTISIANGRTLARKTLNERLGIVGGLSILGTSGVVIPFSCAAWIHTIQRGIDVARAMGIDHIVGSTGSVSEKAAQSLYALSDTALIEMGDFVGGMLKYLHRKPVPRVTIAGGVAKMTKLALGHLDLHSSRVLADPKGLVELANNLDLNAETRAKMRSANTVSQAFDLAGDPRLGARIAEAAACHALRALNNPQTILNVVIFDRRGVKRGESPFLSAVSPKT